MQTVLLIVIGIILILGKNKIIEDIDNLKYSLIEIQSQLDEIQKKGL